MVGFEEVNFDGLVGPTHHYGGLAIGNMASQKNRYLVSKPREAALQGLSKMKILADAGFYQAILPPQVRPDFSILRQIGYRGTNKEVLRNVLKDNSSILSNCCSASSMWVANSATISPSCDTKDGKIHITPANLMSHFHRSIEAKFTTNIFRRIFADQKFFCVHTPLPSIDLFSDEGAANVCRLTNQHGKSGLEIFVYGKNYLNAKKPIMRIQPRQSKESFEAIARNHQLKNNFFLIQQNPKVIELGVFHNDVIAVSNENVFLYHEEAFASRLDLSKLKKYASKYVDNLFFIEIKKRELSVNEAVSTYLFNSQILSCEKGEMVLIAPMECYKNLKVRNLIENRILKNTPIKDVHYFDLRESMQNGGGPACLRLRVVMNSKQRMAIKGNLFLNDQLYLDLKKWVTTYYPKKLTLKDLSNYELIQYINDGLIELESILKLKGLYKEFLPKD